MRETAVVPHGTSWGAVLGGWIASIGMTALLAPLVASALGGRTLDADDLALAVPPMLGVMIAYLIGGYVAGRMAGYSTSWHGMMTAFFGLFVVLALIVVGIAADRGVFGSVRLGSLDGAVPWAFAGAPAIGNAVTFGAVLGFLATIFAGWLGGLLAPTRSLVAATPAVAPAPVPGERVVRETRVSERRRPGFRLLPQAGRKGGERVETERVERVEKERIDRTGLP